MDLRKQGNIIFIANILLIVTLFFTSVLIPSGKVAWANEHNHNETITNELREVIEGIIQWKKKTHGINKNDYLFNNQFLENAGDTSVDWYPIGIGRVGYDEDYDSYLAVIKDVVRKRYEHPHKLSKAKATEWHRISLAILASGGDPRNIGRDEKDNTIDLIADGTYNRGKTQSIGAQGLNGWIWGLIALDSMRYKVPSDAYYSREEIIKNILSSQLEDGGFSLLTINKEMDVDITAMAIQALAPYYNSEETFTYERIVNKKEETRKVREVIDEALHVLSKKQTEDGEFTSWGVANVESTVQVIVALTSLGINPLTDERFIKNGYNLLDVLLRYRQEDGGFVHSFTYDPDNPSSIPDESNSLATEQSLIGLASLLRYIEGYRNLYDFREEIKPEIKSKINSLNELIIHLPDEITEEHRVRVEKLFSYYLEIPITERMYVYAYSKLADAMEKLNITNTSEPFTTNFNEYENGNGTITPIFNHEEIGISETLFTEADVERVRQLPEKITTEHEVEIIKLLERLNYATNKEKFKAIETDLVEKRKEIEKLKEEIDYLNKHIINHLYPFENIRIKDKEKVEEIIDRYEALSEYDRQKVQGYEDVEKAYTQIVSLIRARYIAITIIVMIVAMTAVLIFRIKKRKKEKMINMMD